MATGGFAVKEANGIAQNPLFAKLCGDLDQTVKGDYAFAPYRDLDQTVKGDYAPSSTGSSKDLRTRNKDLQKTRLCIYFAQGKCGLGTSCQFAHSASEIRKAPNLTKTALCTNFMNGNCKNRNCSYAHGEAELVKPPSFKKKECVWFKQGKCRNGSKCGFIHDSSELGGEGAPPEENERKPWKSAGCAPDCDASTAVPATGSPQTGSPRSQSQMETDVTMMATKSIPDEHLFRMMAGRGSAPLQQQVKSMGLAIGELQEKLYQVQGRQQASSDVIEGAALQQQVDEMQRAIDQLSRQYDGMEVGMQLSSLRSKQQPPPTMPHPSTKVRSNVSTHQKGLGPNDSSDDIGSPALLHLAKKAQPTQSSYVKHLSRQDHRPVKTSAKRDLSFEMRVALGMLVVAIMVMVEVGLR